MNLWIFEPLDIWVWDGELPWGVVTATGWKSPNVRLSW